MTPTEKFVEEELAKRIPYSEGFEDAHPSEYTLAESLTGYEPPPEPEDDFSAMEEFTAAFDTSNPLLPAAMNFMRGEDFAPVEGYHPLKDKVTDGYQPGLFVESDSPQQTRQIIERVRLMRLKARQDKGFGSVASAAGHVAGIVTNPVNMAAMFVPGGLARVVAAEVAAESANEVMRHSMEPERTFTQSALSVGMVGAGTAAIGGVIKGVQAYGNRSRPGPDEAIARNLEPHGGLSANPAFAEKAEPLEKVVVQDIEMVRAMGGSIVAPSVKVLASKHASEEGKNILIDLVDIPVRLESGKATSPVESLIKKADGEAYKLKVGAEKILKTLPDSGTGFDWMGRKWDASMEMVSDAMNNGDKHAIPQIAKVAALFRALDSTLFKTAVKAGLYGKKPPKENPNHLQRVYMKDKIIANRSGFKEVIIRGLLKNQNERAVVKLGDDVHTVDPADVPALKVEHGDNLQLLDVGEGSIDKIADDIIDTILGNKPTGKDNHVEYAGVDHLVPLAGSLHERTLDFIPYGALKPFIETDALAVMNITANQMIRSIEMANKFGDPSMVGALAKVREEFRLKKSTATGKEAAAIEKAEKQEIKIITALRDQIHGTYKRPDMSNRFVQAGRVAKVATQMVFGANILASSIPDIVAPSFRHGFKAHYNGLRVLMSGEGKSYRQFVNMMGVGINSTTNARVLALAGSQHQMKWEQNAMRVWAKYTGLNWFTDMTQSWNAIGTSEMWINQLRNGPTAKQAKKLHERGINPAMGERIKRQLISMKMDNGITMPNTHLWPDKGAAAAYESALRTEVASTTIIPGIGDLPLWTRHEVGTHIAMYTSFVTSAHNKLLISGMQRRDADMLMGILAGATVGMMAAAIKDGVRGKDISDKDMGQWVVDGVDRAGIGGWMMSPVKGAYTAATGNLPSSWVVKKGAEGILTPPTIKYAADVYGLGAKAINPDEELTALEIAKRFPMLNAYHAVDLLENYVLDK